MARESGRGRKVKGLKVNWLEREIAKPECAVAEYDMAKGALSASIAGQLSLASTSWLVMEYLHGLSCPICPCVTLTFSGPGTIRS